MKFRRLIEDIDFRNVKIDNNGDIIDVNTGAVIGTTRAQDTNGASKGSAQSGKVKSKEGNEEVEGKRSKGKGKGKGRKIETDGKLYYDPNYGGVYKRRSLDPIYTDDEDPFAWFDTNITDDDDSFQKGNDEN